MRHILSGCLLLPLLACTEQPTPEGRDLDATARRRDKIRLVSWNIETIGAPGSVEYDALLDVLARLDADVVAIQEIASSADQANLWPLAADAGYANVVVGSAGFGSDHVAILSRRAILDSAVLDSVALSGDPAADDLTRHFVRAEIETIGAPLVVVTNHWKCCSGDTNEFRRSVESIRAAQAVAGYDPTSDPIVVIGDFNEDPADLPLSPASFSTTPSGLPASFWLGQDLYDQLVYSGIDNDPIAPLTGAGLSMVSALQRDGSPDTYLTGGTLDVAFVSSGLLVSGAEIYDDADEALPSVLHLGTAPLLSGTVAAASDHHPLALEILVRR